MVRAQKQLKGGSGGAAGADPAAGSTDRVGTGEKPAERRDPQKNDGDLTGGGGEGSLRLTRNRGTSPEVSDSRRRRWRGRGGAVQLGKAEREES